MAGSVDRRAFLGTAAKLGAVSVAAPVVLLEACGGGGGGPASSSGGSGSLNWSYWATPAEAQIFQQVKTAFEKAHSGITLNPITTNYSSYQQKLDSMIAGGQTPDVMFLNSVTKYAAEGAIEQLDPWVKKSGMDLSVYYPHFLDDMKYNGKLYALERDGDVNVLYYKVDDLKSAGLSAPDKSWTWNTFQSALQKLTKKSGSHVNRYGLAMEYGKYWIWMGELGGWWLDDAINPTKCTLDEPKALEALKFQAGLINNDLMQAIDATTSSDLSSFQPGLCSMIIQNASRIPTLNQQSGFDYALAPVPRPTDGTWATSAGGAGWGMSAKSKNKDAAWTFISWLQSPKGGQPIFASSSELFPAIKQVAESASFVKPPPPGKSALGFMGQYAKTIETALFPEWSQLSQEVIEPSLEKVWTGGQSVDQVVPPLVQQVNTFLKQHGYPKKS
ncbi:MAG: sugar ABC transporter substrate-binding protein [Candidatus Dormiibacterota bacterium]